MPWIDFAPCYCCGFHRLTIQLDLPHPQRWCVPCIEGAVMAGIAAKTREVEQRVKTPIAQQRPFPEEASDV